MSEPKRPLKVFLCHSSQDKPTVKELYDRLISEGWIDPWLDKERLKLGDDFDLEIEKAIESTDAVIAFISENAVKKTGYIQKELRLVYDAQMYRPDGELFTIPLRLEGCEPPHRFKYWHWGDYFGEEKEKTYQSLLNSLKLIHERVLKSEVAEKTQLEAEELERQKTAKEKAKYEVAEKKEKPVVAKSKIVGEISYWFGGFIVLVLGIVYLSSLNKPSATTQPTSENTQTQVAITLTQDTVDPSVTASPKSTSTPVSTLTPIPLPTEITDAKGVSMALVPAGDFIMGSGGSNEKSAHTVYLDDYYIDKYEVTNASYKECVDADVCLLPSNTGSASRGSYYGNPIFDHYPVIYVSWNSANSYCEWRNTSLPTEAQWEKAARGDDARTYPWGEETSCNRTNYSSCVGDTTEVGSYPSGVSPYGIYDLAGNVWEWVADWYSDGYYQDSPTTNPTGPNIGQFRVLRGGSWINHSDLISSSIRDKDYPTYNGGLVGFRCASLASQVVIKDLPTEIRDAQDIHMVLVPAGEFMMGNTAEDSMLECEKYQSNCKESRSLLWEEPPHLVYLDAFYIDKYEVTNAQYKACVKADVCSPPFDKKSSTHSDYYDNLKYDSYPFMGAFWSGAILYCQWRGATLPTEAQWEKAARGTDGRAYPWGSNFDGSKANSCDKNCNSDQAITEFDDGYADVAPVGSYPEGVSPYGVYDMAGNVWEFVADWYSETYYEFSPYNNPLGPTSGEELIARGGSWGQTPARLRTSARFPFSSSIFLSGGVGFRCAKDARP